MSADIQHTPGPWLVQVEQDGEFVVWTRQSHIGTLATVHSEDINGLWPVEANARLIAAAPEGHEIIEQLEESFTADGTYQQFLPAMRAYLAKVRGGANGHA